MEGTPLDVAEDSAFNLQLFDLESEFDANYGLLAPQQTVLVRAYTDDTDDQVLAEIQPKFVVMFEPNMEFIRRIEVSGNVYIWKSRRDLAVTGL